MSASAIIVTLFKNQIFWDYKDFSQLLLNENNLEPLLSPPYLSPFEEQVNSVPIELSRKHKFLRSCVINHVTFAIKVIPISQLLGNIIKLSVKLVRTKQFFFFFTWAPLMRGWLYYYQIIFIVRSGGTKFGCPLN